MAYLALLFYVTITAGTLIFNRFFHKNQELFHNELVYIQNARTYQIYLKDGEQNIYYKIRN